MEVKQTFTAEVKVAGINPYVDVPEDVVNALGGEKKLAVLVKLHGMDPISNKDIAASKQKSWKEMPRG